MSSVNYSLKHKGVKLIPSEKAWIKGKNGKPKLNPKYAFVGKIDTKTPNLIISATDNKKPVYKGALTICVCRLRNRWLISFITTRVNRMDEQRLILESRRTSSRRSEVGNNDKFLHIKGDNQWKKF